MRPRHPRSSSARATCCCSRSRRSPCHSDGNRLNNSDANLRYDSRSGNELDKIQHGTSNRGERHGLSKASPTDIPVIRARVLAGEVAKAIGADFGLSARAITHMFLLVGGMAAIFWWI